MAYQECGADGAPLADESEEDAAAIRHEQTIWVGQSTSACEQCTDTTDLRTMPLGNYAEGMLGKHVIIGPVTTHTHARRGDWKHPRTPR